MEIKNDSDTLKLVNGFLTRESINLLVNKYSIDENLINKPINIVKNTAKSFSLYTDNKVVSFGENNYYSDKKVFVVETDIKKLYANNVMFCAITNNDKVIFWGNENKKQNDKYNVNVDVSIIEKENYFIGIEKETNNMYFWSNESINAIKNIKYYFSSNGLNVIKKNNTEFHYYLNDNFKQITKKIVSVEEAEVLDSLYKLH